MAPVLPFWFHGFSKSSEKHQKLQEYFNPANGLLAPPHFYGDETASATMGGACGYGTETVGVSSALFNNGYAYSCGACYQNVPYITVTPTPTNLCPPNWAQHSDSGGWCNQTRTHFDKSKPAFINLAISHTGIVPVMHRREECVNARGGIRFSPEGKGYEAFASVFEAYLLHIPRHYYCLHYCSSQLGCWTHLFLQLSTSTQSPSI